MANEKILNTRVQLKYDSYANWTSENLGDGKGAKFVLKAGEIGICYLPTDYSEGQVVGSQPPQILFKVGNGTAIFSELPWVSAKAADVYAWAKQASLPVTKEGTGNVVANIAWDEVTKGIKFTTVSVATSEGLEQLNNRVSTIEKTYASDNDLSAAVEVINAAIALKADKTYVDEQLGLKVNVSDFNTFKTDSTAAIATAKAAGDNAQSDLNAYKTSNDVAVAKKADQTALDAVSATANAAATKTALEEEIARAKAAEEANAAAIVRLTEGVSQEEIDGVNDLINYVNEHGTEVTGMKEDITDNAKTISDEVARATAKENELTGLINTNIQNIQNNTDAIDALNITDGKVEKAKSADVASSLDDAAIAQVKEIVVNKATDADTVDGMHAADFATKAQGALADTALQKIMTTENGGLVVTNNNQIDIDSNVVFVFKCGSSTELV